MPLDIDWSSMVIEGVMARCSGEAGDFRASRLLEQDGTEGIDMWMVKICEDGEDGEGLGMLKGC
jgi:hypothetical protein